MKIKRKFILLSSIFLPIAVVGTPIVLTSCANTSNNSYDDSDEKNGKVKDIINNPKNSDGSLKYELTQQSDSTSEKPTLTFAGTHENESGEIQLKTVDEVKKDVAPNRNDWSDPIVDEFDNEVYKLKNYNDLQGFQNFWMLTSDFYIDYSDTTSTKLDKTDLDANSILSNSLSKEIWILKDVSSSEEDPQQEDNAPIVIVVSISLKPGFVWKSNGLDYSLSFAVYLAEKTE
ncbi:MAG: hypothetical protein K2H56_00635 [Malacoplasma sp.]|nr:hypothetical protein [Malacoplasma sp.]MDE7099915.1 hypothetical protein [Malacoplasma sp.]